MGFCLGVIAFFITLSTAQADTADVYELCKDSDHSFATSAVEGCLIANEIRAKNRKPLMELDASLTATAAKYAKELDRTGRFSHTGADGSTLKIRLERNHVRYYCAGENLNKGYTSTRRAFEVGWMNSPKHKKNLMNSEFLRQGFAVSGTVRVHLFAGVAPQPKTKKKKTTVR